MTDQPGRPCIECAYYVYRPGWLQSLLRIPAGTFQERCAHPAHADEVDGSPKPCITMRIKDCDGRNRFKPKAYDAKAHSECYP